MDEVWETTVPGKGQTRPASLCTGSVLNRRERIRGERGQPALGQFWSKSHALVQLSTGFSGLPSMLNPEHSLLPATITPNTNFLSTDWEEIPAKVLADNSLPCHTSLSLFLNKRLLKTKVFNIQENEWISNGRLIDIVTETDCQGNILGQELAWQSSKLNHRSSHPLLKIKANIYWPYCASPNARCFIYIITLIYAKILRRRYQLCITDEETKLRNGQTAKVGGKRECTKGLCSFHWVPLPPSSLTTFLKASIPHNHTPSVSTSLRCDIPERCHSRSQAGRLAPEHTLIHTANLSWVAINLHKCPWGGQFQVIRSTCLDSRLWRKNHNHPHHHLLPIFTVVKMAGHIIWILNAIRTAISMVWEKRCFNSYLCLAHDERLWQMDTA